MSDPDADDLEDEIEIEDLEDEEIVEEGADGEEDDLEVEPPPVKKPLTKGQRQFVDLRKRAQVAEERAARAEEQAARNSGAIDVLSRQQSAPNAEQQRQEAERLANMTPEERIEFRIGQERSQIQSAFAQQGFRTEDTIDILRFERLCEKNQAYDGVASEVEKRLSDMRAKGQNVERKILANVVLGERAAAQAGKKAVKKTEVRQKTVKGGGSDIPGERSRTRQPKTAAQRLEGVKF